MSASTPSLLARLTLTLTILAPLATAEDWPQFKFDARHSGNAPGRRLETPLDLIGAAPCTDAIFTAPAVADGRVYVVDGSGVAWCFDAETLEVVWKFATETVSKSGLANCNNVSSPAVVDGFLHFGTMAGIYYVLNAADGQPVQTIEVGDPIFSAPVVVGDRVYFGSLGSRVYALTPQGDVRWTWDFVAEMLDFHGDRWSGEDWLREKGKPTWEHQFCMTRNLAASGKTLVVPAGGLIVWLDDGGDRAVPQGVYRSRREAPVTLGLSLDESGAVYRQWTRRDNGGNVEILRRAGGKISVDFVRGTETSYRGPGSLSFSSVSLRDGDVYRCRPEEGFGLCRHRAVAQGAEPDDEQTEQLGGYPSISSPLLLEDSAVYGALDGGVYVVPLDGATEPWSFATPFGAPISAPVAVADGRVYVACEDGYLYALGPDGKAPPPTVDLQLREIRSPLTSRMTESRYNWSTSFGNPANTNANRQGLRPPLKLKWIRRFEGTVKHFSVCDGQRVYTHTAEGQIFAVEQETGRLLWRRFYPGVHISYTSPLIHDGRLYVPQAGMKKCRLRCLDAASGELVWEAPFSGSPSWNRQIPPILCGDLIIYQFSSAAYPAENWLFEHQSTFGFPDDQKPLVRAWNVNTGEEVWTRDFSQFGHGGDDAGMCLSDGRLYYSCYFGDKDPSGVTAAIEPATGELLWTNTEHSVHAGCAPSAADGRLYLGGYNPVDGDVNRVWCLDTSDGSLVWQSDPVRRAIHVITIGQDLLFTHAQYYNGYLLDKQTGKILSTLTEGYRCTRFTLSEPYLVGPNMTLFDLADGNQLASAGPVVDVLQCVGSFISNGRLFQTTNGGGLQVSMSYGEEAQR